MKRLLLVVLLILVHGYVSVPSCTRSVGAAPFLTCDCTPAVDKVSDFVLQFGLQPEMTVPAFNRCLSLVCPDPAQKVICYDLAGLPEGPFEVRAKAKNIWGVASTYTDPLSDVKALPSFLRSLRIINQ